MCMTLAMSLGMSIGVRRTMWMMLGELIAVSSIAIASLLGMSALIQETPQLFTLLKLAGSLYLIWLGINMFRSKGKLALSKNSDITVTYTKTKLLSQGFITAIANPKGWAFMLSLLPPFINYDYALLPQVTVLVVIIIISEFICMMIYAQGGKSIGQILTAQNNVKLMNKISGSLMILVAIWLFMS